MRRSPAMLAAVAAALAFAPTLAARVPVAGAPIAAAIADPHRDADRARDVYRHPAQTLRFFRIAPSMTVVDVSPGSGWYTRVLLPYLGPRGRYVALAPASGDDATPGFDRTFPAKAAGWAGSGAAPVVAYASDAVPATLDGTVDRVIIMREVHNLVGAGTFAQDLATYRRVLKPGGLLGIEEHRAKPAAPAAYADGSKGYMKQADVIRLVEAAGYRLVATSEINANPKDPADWPGGVWTLPPTYAKSDVDRATLAAIGESDRMTLLFAKR